VRDPSKIKQLYVQEGAGLLQKIKPRPEGKECRKQVLSKAPNPTKERPFTEEKPAPQEGIKPHWWDKMYDRKAKGIPAETWKDLITKPELLATIAGLDKHKAAGYDGVNSDLLKLLVVEGSAEDVDCRMDALTCASISKKSPLGPVQDGRRREASFANSCITEMGRISGIVLVSDPSSLSLGIIEIIDFRHDLWVIPS